MTPPATTLIIAIVSVYLFLLSRYRPFFSLGAGLAAGWFAAYRGFSVWVQIIVFTVVTVIVELIMIKIYALFAKEKDDPRITEIVGKNGKLRDFVDKDRDKFLLHCEGADFIAIPRVPGAVLLGDHVRVVGVKGKKAIVEKADPAD